MKGWLLIVIGLVLIALAIYGLTRKQEARIVYLQPTPPQQLITSSKNEAQVIVKGTDRWKDTGITVKKGQTVKISASGSIVWDGALPAVGPEGSIPASRVEHPSDFPMPQAACGSLVMRIGSSLYPVGAGDTVVASEGGTIKFIVNDRYEYLWNNIGSFSVQVEVR